jgi:hypothetical protein
VNCEYPLKVTGTPLTANRIASNLLLLRSGRQSSGPDLIFTDITDFTDPYLRRAAVTGSAHSIFAMGSALPQAHPTFSVSASILAHLPLCFEVPPSPDRTTVARFDSSTRALPFRSPQARFQPRKCWVRRHRSKAYQQTRLSHCEPTWSARQAVEEVVVRSPARLKHYKFVICRELRFSV